MCISYKAHMVKPTDEQDILYDAGSCIIQCVSVSLASFVKKKVKETVEFKKWLANLLAEPK